ncbi:MAG TPA: glycosyltransferase family 2 protein [Bdellovibrionota bacterium]
MKLTPLDPKIFFSVVIPAHNEEKSLPETIGAIAEAFAKRNISDYEILVVNDNSSDGTEAVLVSLEKKIPFLRHVNNRPPHGFGYALRKGIESFRGQSICFVMADLSDHPRDILAYYDSLKAGYECVFGSRFIRESKVIDYPIVKLWLNRCANLVIKYLFWIKHNDITNAFKAYRREVIEGLLPIVACHFNLTVELPLKAIVRGYTFRKIPISWTNRKHGVSKLKIEEMGSRYLFIVLYVWLEKMLTGEDYMRRMRVANKPTEEDSAKSA